MPSATSYTKAAIDALLAANKGIPGRTILATPSQFPVSASGSGKLLVPHTWSFIDQETGASVSTLVDFPGSQALAMASAGWWQLSLQIAIGFQVNTTPLPDHVLVAYSSYNDTIETSQEIACTPAPGYNHLRNIHGCEARVMSHIFYQPASGITGGSIQPNIFWPGDASPKSPTNGNPPFVRLFATRLG